MGRSKTLALWAILCCGSLSGAAEAESFTIRSPAAVGRIEVRYFLTGAFGGYGSFVPDSDEDGAYRIPLEQDGRMATSLKAILYAQGCQFTILSVDLLSDSTRTATFGCQALSSITLAGKVLAAPSSTRALDVEVRYLSSWDHKLFGIKDGMIQSFSVGKAPLKAGGRFQIQIPDFSRDRVTIEMQEAFLELLVVEHSTWNIVERVLPSGDLQYEGVGLKILSSYNSEISFVGRR